MTNAGVSEWPAGLFCNLALEEVAGLADHWRSATNLDRRAPCPAATRPPYHLAEAKAEVEVLADRNIKGESRTHHTFSPNSACLVPSRRPRLPSNRDHRIDVGAPIRFARRVEPSNSRRRYILLPADVTHRSHIYRHRRDIPMEADLRIFSGSRRTSGKRRRTAFHRIG
jgi:hypothetical protein